MSDFLAISTNPRYADMIVSKETIEREAQAAAQQGVSLNDACPYPFAGEAGRHFRDVYERAVREGGAA